MPVYTCAALQLERKNETLLGSIKIALLQRLILLWPMQEKQLSQADINRSVAIVRFNARTTETR